MIIVGPLSTNNLPGLYSDKHSAISGDFKSGFQYSWKPNR